jgi:hypothetical protein
MLIGVSCESLTPNRFLLHSLHWSRQYVSRSQPSANCFSGREPASTWQKLHSSVLRPHRLSRRPNVGVSDRSKQRMPLRQHPPGNGTGVRQLNAAFRVLSVSRRRFNRAVGHSKVKQQCEPRHCGATVFPLSAPSHRGNPPTTASYLGDQGGIERGCMPPGHCSVPRERAGVR